MAVECPICGAELKLDDDVVAGELVECTDCATELEVESVDPIMVSEAPTEDEDWGE